MPPTGTRTALHLISVLCDLTCSFGPNIGKAFDERGNETTGLEFASHVDMYENLA